jgi:hypothetical protein
MIPDAYLAAMSVADSTALWLRALTAASSKANDPVAANGQDIVGSRAGLPPEQSTVSMPNLPAIYLRRDSQRAESDGDSPPRLSPPSGRKAQPPPPHWVIAGQGVASAFYERLGAELLVEQPFQWDGMDLVEVGYGWRDLDALAAALSGQKAISREPAAKLHSGEKA